MSIKCCFSTTWLFGGICPLTTGIDIIPGLIGSLGTTDTSGNDIIIGQNTGFAFTWTMNPADQIDAGGGTFNQFKLFAGGMAAEIAQTQFPTLNHVQGLWINHIGFNASDAFATPFDVTTSKFPALTALQLDDIGGGASTGMIWVKLAHQSLTISGDSGYGGESIGIFSAVDTSENVIFSGAGKTHNHDSVWVYGTNAVGSTDSGLTITSTGAANFADYGNGGLHNPLSSITFAHSASGDTAFPGINWGSGGTVETTDASAFTGALTLGSVAALLLLLLLVLSLRQLSSVIQVQARLPATLSSLVPARPIFLRTLSLMVPVVITSHCWLVIRPLTRWTVPRLLVGVEQCRDLHFRS